MGKSKESALFALFTYLFFEALVHWHPALRSSWDFLPRELGGDVNEFVTLWVHEHARNARAMGFGSTLWLVNPWSDGTYYASHPGLLTFLTALWETVFGDAPATLRRLALMLFALRIGFLHSLVSEAWGRACGRVAVAIYLLVPTTQTYTHALSFEVISGTFVLGAFWARPWWGRALLMAAAALVDYTALLALPVWLWKSPKRAFSGLLVALFVGFQFLWARSFSTGAEELASRVYMFLLGPWHVLRSNPDARSQLFESLRMSFPLLVILPFLWDIFLHRGRGRPAWWWGALSAGLAFHLVFLGVFRVHPYTSQLLIVPLCAAAARGLLALWNERRWSTRVALAFMLLSALLRMSYPWQTPGHAAAREALRQEALKINHTIAGRDFTIESDLRFLRPEPLVVYLDRARWKKAGCAEYAVAYREAGPPWLELKAVRCP